MIDFAPLPIKQKALKAEPITRYRVEPPTGKPVVVEAPSAAEAFRLSGLPEAKRIVNLDVERLNLVAAGLLQPEDVTVTTSIGLDESELPEFFNAELPEDAEEAAEFEAVSLGDLSQLTLKGRTGVTISPVPQTPAATLAVAAEPEPVAAVNPPPVVEDSAAVEAPESHDVYEIGVLPQGALETSRELTPEEIRNLLKNETPPE